MCLIDTVSAAIPIKPAFGAPCNGCGHCCKTEACRLSVEYLHSTATPCIALEADDGRYYCGLVRNPGKYLGMQDDRWRWDAAREVFSSQFAYLLRLGAGCDAED